MSRLRPRGAVSPADHHRGRRQYRPVPCPGAGSASHPQVSAHLIEVDRARAQSSPTAADRTVVLHGDIRDPEILEEANVRAAEPSSRSPTMTRSTSWRPAGQALRLPAAPDPGQQQRLPPLLTALGIDVAVNPRDITVSSILQHVRRGRIKCGPQPARRRGRGVRGRGAGDLAAWSASRCARCKLPGGVIVGAIVRGEE